jgi:hypothetical protein
MRDVGGNLILSAIDLSNFLSCRHRTSLEMAAARGKRKRPHFHDPLLEILFKRGLDHEKGHVQSLESAGRRVLDVADVKEPGDAVAQALHAMRTRRCASRHGVPVQSQSPKRRDFARQVFCHPRREPTALRTRLPAAEPNEN